MSAPRVIPDTVRDRQIAASNPDVSAWVAANAGAGKTHVLAQRVIRLLLKGIEPARILCITFTKAAAANMANRVFDTLGQWTALDDHALDKEMKKIGVGEIDDDLRGRARQLFARALETPGGLKVQTIHAFCTRLLHQFPFEAKVAARFTVLDEAAETQLLDQLCLKILLEAAANPSSPRGRALATAIATAADQTFREMLSEAIRERDALMAWVDSAGSVAAATAQLSRALGVDPKDSEEKIDADIFGASAIKSTEWLTFAAALAEGSKTDNDHSGRFASLVKLAGTERNDTYFDIFLTKERAPRKNIVTKGIQTKHPALFARLVAEQDRICALLERQRGIAVRDRTAALVTIAAEVIERFRSEKERRGALDYDDLIDKTLALLSTTSAAWVHYKLDQGIDHVLIDEAQDTSPKQWAIVRALVSEFFAGEGAQTTRRTIFAVGDEKQSIFSFQGAAPREFESMRREFDKLSKAVARELQHVRFDHSFRSGANVLAAVDCVFESREVFTGVTTDHDGFPPHNSLPEVAPGLVEIWDTEKPTERREIEGWDAPFDNETETSPVVRLARKIAKTIGQWRRAGTRPGDVLILVRRRGALFEAIIRALKQANIPVAGADRMVLTEHIAVMDLIALADALLLPDDDLAFATVLKSPLFGLDDEQLFRLAWNRKGTLRAALQAKSGEDVLFAQAAMRLDHLAQAARHETPFSFYARLLNTDDGRKRILARLGHEAADALDEFLNLALDYERNETPTLQGFVAWVRAARASIKRDMEITRDEVRVMTVHGAKGLEARTVILADTITPPEGWHPPKLLALPIAQAAPGAPDILIWAPRKADDVGPIAPARAAALQAGEEEYRRLLYVAMTRAAERLVVCGAEGERGWPARCWYDLVREALKSGSVEEPLDDGDGIVWRYRKEQAAPAVSEILQEGERTQIVLPAWLVRDARAEPPGTTMTPSNAAEGVENNRAGDGDARKTALLRGTLVHRLMQSLPDMAPERREDAARRFLARAEKRENLSAVDRDQIFRQVLTVLDDPQFAALFAPGSRAEMPIVGRVNGNLVPGQVDRLAVTPEAVLIADYKTNRPVPRTLDEVPEAYVKQLALYRAVLVQLYPDRPVRAALVWTEVPQLMEIPSAALDAALAKL